MNINRQKSKIELYQEKLKERENNNENYFFDILSNNNKFAKTINLQNNSLKNQEENNKFNENNILNRNATPNPHNINNNFQKINQLSLNQNLNQTDIFSNYDINNNNMKNRNNSFNNFNLNPSEENNNMNYLKILNTNSRRTNIQSLRNINKNDNNNNLLNDPYGNTYKGTHILPRDMGNTLKEEKYNQNQILKNIWAEEMKEKKIREEKEKQKQKELDLLEDERIKRDIEEEKMKEEQEKQRKKEKEKNLAQDNALLIENKKNLVENENNEYTQNNYNYYNNEFLEQVSDLNNKLNYYNNRKFEYKNIDLNNIHFYRSNKNTNNMNQIQNYKNKIKNKQNNNMNRRVNEFEFAPNPRQMDDSKNPQISKLKKEVNSGYMEISSLFKKLKNSVIEANQNKNRAEKELKYITDEINKEKKYHMQLEKKKYEQMKPEEIYNNYYANVRDVDPIYYTKNEANLEENNMSNLAKAGQNLIRLTAQSECIPIGSNTYDNNIIIGENMDNNNFIGDKVSSNNMEIESETIFQPKEDGNY